jgi:quercetin dioxygenase-like cupin family protein
MHPSAETRVPADWPEWRRDEFARNTNNACVGHVLVSETDKVRVWLLTLAPGERIPFHRHVLTYFWTAVTSGTARSHYGDGRVTETNYEAGDTQHLYFGRGESMMHDLENIGKTDLVFTTVEFLDSPNEALPVPENVRRKGAAATAPIAAVA